MRKLVHCSIVMALIGLAGAYPLEAQEEGGIGGIMDWILKMSGPGLRGWGGTLWLPIKDAEGETQARIRGSISWMDSGSSDDAVSPAGSQIDVTTVQGALEFPMGENGNWDFGVGIGIARHEFGGDAEEFIKVSMPFYGYASHPIKLGFVGVVQGGFHYFRPFDDPPFAPLDVRGIATDGFGELSPWIVVGLEFVWH